MSKTRTRIVKVHFHIGSYIGPEVQSGAAPGLKNVVSVEYATLPEGPKGVVVVSNKAGKSYTNFIPITNITSSEIVIEPDPATSLAMVKELKKAGG